MATYFIEVKSDHIVTSEPDPEDEWDHGCDAYINHDFKVFKNNINYPEATITSNIERPFEIVVIYGDGCTFGHTNGLTQLIGPFTEAESRRIAKLIKDEMDLDLDKTDPYFYPKWRGYFAHLQEVKLIDLENNEVIDV